jgi:SIR2-like protein
MSEAERQFSTGSTPPESHFGTIIKGIVEGRVVPLLGAGVNLCGRPDGVRWHRDQADYLPSGTELSSYLAQSFQYPEDDRGDLARVSQYVQTIAGSGPLYEELRGLLNADYPPTPLHQLLASLPAILVSKGYRGKYQLIVTTNYDDVMERTLTAAGEPHDVVSYLADGEFRGKFLHRMPSGETQLIERPNEYQGLPLDERRDLRRPVVLKLHGAVDRASSDNDSYVITEDHYIDYLTRSDISNLIPVTLREKLRRSHFLFLGYSLRDWNLRVILHRIWGEQKVTYKSWAIQLHPDQLEQQFWLKRDVEILDLPLQSYVAGLVDRLNALAGTQRA